MYPAPIRYEKNVSGTYPETKKVSGYWGVRIPSRIPRALFNVTCIMQDNLGLNNVMQALCKLHNVMHE